MPNNDREVFERFAADKNSSREIQYIAYAIFAHEKSEWIKHYENGHGGQAPAQADIDNWIGNLTDYQLQGMSEKAIDFFDTAARDYMAPELSAAVAGALDSAIIKEVKAAGGFWRQLGLALAAAIIAPIIIGGVIVLWLVFSDRFPGIRDIMKDIPAQTDKTTAPETPPK